jgi:2-hydroxymuconate-semialdehyde hydrolase
MANAEVATGTLQTGGYSTHYNRAGEGNDETVLFLHGSGPGATAWSNWQFALPALGEDFDCIGPDMIGYGDSAHPEHPPHGTDEWLEVWLDQISSILDQLDLEKVHIVGNSMGGALALHFLKRNPEKVGRLVLMGTMGTPHQIRDGLADLWGFYDDPSPENMKKAIERFVYDPAIVGGDLDAIAEARYEAAMDEDTKRSFASMFPAPRQQHVDNLALPDSFFQSIENPTLLVHGRDDVIIPLETSLYLLERLPQVQMHVFGRCRHWIMIEHREAFNDVVADFLG